MVGELLTDQPDNNNKPEDSANALNNNAIESQSDSHSAHIFESLLANAEESIFDLPLHNAGPVEILYISGVPTVFYLKASDEFQLAGACIDTGAARSVIGLPQTQAYCNESSRPYSLQPSNVTFQFGIGRQKAWGYSKSAYR